MRITIGITDTESRYQNYFNWIKEYDDTIEIVKLGSSNFDELKKCDGLIMSGGVDTHPSFYNNPRLNYPLAPNEFNPLRDEFEIKIFHSAQEKKIPLLAICRGMQLVNCILGGDLIQDIEESGKQDHRRHGDTDGIHGITVEKDSLLYSITKSEEGIINSAHHQAVGKIASELRVTAHSPDGIAEAAEWKNRENKSFLLCVQWHPERLEHPKKTNPFTFLIREEFLNEVKNNKIKI